jgi:hypothetical protein
VILHDYQNKTVGCSAVAVQGFFLFSQICFCNLFEFRVKGEEGKEAEEGGRGTKLCLKWEERGKKEQRGSKRSKEKQR